MVVVVVGGEVVRHVEVLEPSSVEPFAVSSFHRVVIPCRQQNDWEAGKLGAHLPAIHVVRARTAAHGLRGAAVGCCGALLVPEASW